MKFVSILLFLVFAILRLVGLINLPIFNDEAIYIDWGWRQTHLKDFMFYSLSDAKQPLMLWLFSLAQFVFSDSLWGARFISFLFGLGTIVGIYCIGKTFFDRRVALIAGFVYALTPIFFFFDRQALVESGVSFIGVWVCFFLLKIHKKNTIPDAIILGLLLGVGFYIKSSAALFFFPLFIFSLIRKISISRFLTIIGASQLVLIPLYLQPIFWQSLGLNSRYLALPSALLIRPIDFLEILFWQLTPLVFTGSVLGIYTLLKKRSSFTNTLLIYVAVPVLFTVFFAKDLIPRYLVSFLPLMSLVFAVGLTSMIKKTPILICVLSVVIISLLAVDLIQIYSPIAYFTSLNKATRFSGYSEYVTGWTSGYGVTEAISVVKKETGKSHSVIGVSLDAGNPQNAAFAYLSDDPLIEVTYFDRKLADPSIETADCIESSAPFFFMSRGSETGGMGKYLVLYKQFKKPLGKEFVGLYKLRADCMIPVL